MSRNFHWRRSLTWAVALMLLTLGTAMAQEETGNLYGTVTDGQGEALPGVTVTVTGIGAPKIIQTDIQGNFRILALDPGFYQLTAELDGFSTVEYPNVNVRVARNTSIQISLSGAVEEVITVTAESPLLDERRIQQGSTITEVELEKIPTARDPWSVLTQTPGVQSDRINVGGNESGQQAVFTGPGVSDAENSFLVDGVEITDMSAIGSSPSYYDFDQFTEMQFSTGGSDVTKSAAGVSVNLVTRRGTNEFRGSSRYMITDQDFLFFKQSNSSISDSELAPGQGEFVANSIRRIEDFGFNAGGPVLRDKLWFWGSWGQNDIKQSVGGGGSDDTILENAAFKVNAQLASNNSAQASWNNGDKQKFGRGAGPDRAQETTFLQRGPTAVIKAEDTHIVSSNLFLTGQWSKVDGGFALRSLAGGFDDSLPETVWDGDGVWKNGFVSGSSSRPAEEIKADGSYFFNTGASTNHELKFGGRFRDFESLSPFGWPGRNIVHIAGENFGNPTGPDDFFFLYRLGTNKISQEYTSFWAQDTITFGQFTINAGLRYDLQEGKNGAGGAPNYSGCDPADLGCLPAIDFPGNDGGGFDWSTISPRLGLTYALGAERRTLLRASLARFPEQLATVNLSQVNPLGASYSYFAFTDQNDNNQWDGVDVDGEPTFQFGTGFDPNNPSSIVSPNSTNSGLKPPVTDEIVLGVEHALMPEFVVGANYTWRQTQDVLEFPSFVRSPGGAARLQTGGDFVADGFFTGALPNGQAFSEPLFALNPGLEFTGGTLQRNGNRTIDYQGFNVNFTKRLANRWMLRGYIAWEDAQWSVPQSFLANDNPLRSGTQTDEASQNLGSDQNGGLFAVQSGGSGNKGDVWLQSSWAFNVNGMYQVAPDRPWGFNLAANVFGREGYPIPYYADPSLSDGTTPNVLVSQNLDSFRLDDILTVDFRVDKDFNASEDVSFTVSLDVFNALNQAYVLQREGDLNGSRANFLDETLSPRIFRLGVRLNWR